MMGDGYDAAWFLLKVFSITGLDKLRPMLTGDDACSRLAARIRTGIRDKALNLLVYGLRKGMTFSEFCRWLNTPYGSDVFADRHWLSRHLQIRVAGGRLPDFVGSYEHLDADWRMVTERLGMPFRELPRLNARPAGMLIEEYLDDDTVALLKRRYADDFRLGGYEADDHYAATRVDVHPADGGP